MLAYIYQILLRLKMYFTKKNLVIFLALMTFITSFLVGCLGDLQQDYQDENDEEYQVQDIKIASFNIQIFGKTKEKKKM